MFFCYTQGVLESLERDLVSFFTDWPSSVYLSDQKNSFERMMLHALCQYLDLMSSSRYFIQLVVCCGWTGLVVHTSTYEISVYHH